MDPIGIVYQIIFVVGTFAMSISGALTAMAKRFDAFGIFIIGFVTAVGGGTTRDILANRTVFWLKDTMYTYAILAGSLFAIIYRKKLNRLLKPLMVFDTIGLAMFTVVGAEIGIKYELSIISCIILGTVTGCMGGIMRDIFVNEIPVIFRKEIYATVSIIGGAIYMVLYYLNVPHTIAQFVPIFFIIIARTLIVRYKVSFPELSHEDTDKRID
ncbi:MAG: trimeric intracellular cation channel family protein [Bacteroidales bacterium]